MVLMGVIEEDERKDDVLLECVNMQDKFGKKDGKMVGFLGDMW